MPKSNETVRHVPIRRKSALPQADGPPSALRSWTMSRVASKNTQPELTVRKAAHALGLRFRLHRTDLPGTPDVVFPARNIALFVHGCFWHRHDCKRATTPISNVAYWTAKFERNVARDRRNILELAGLGWESLRIWECETKDTKKLSDILRLEIIEKCHSTFSSRPRSDLSRECKVLRARRGKSQRVQGATLKVEGVNEA
jgi:DNA mismatch endonuclease, patch repair protein